METLLIIKELVDISEKKKNILKNIIGVIKIQRKFIELQNHEAVLKQNDLKIKYLSEINNLDNQFYALYENFKVNINDESIDTLDLKRYPELKVLKETVKEILTLEKEIKDIEQKNISLLQDCGDALSKKFKQTNQGKRVSDIYLKQKNLIQKEKK